jgi:protein-tyrosine-phosphatase
MHELAHSDRRVGELAAALGRPQNAVSYHLGRLRDQHLVSRRRSAADGRDSYYTLDFERCASLLAEVGASLHPALAPPAPAATGRAPVRILFLCSGNSARSQIAEALARQLGAGSVHAFSAGSRAKPLHPRAIAAMRARGIDISGAETKSFERFRDQRFDVVVSLCDRVREVCPEFPGHPDTVHWSVPDPSAEADGAAAFERTTEELTTRIRLLLARIA